MNNKQIILSEKTLLQNPLFWSGQGSIAVKSGQSNIFLGTGVATPGELSKGIPFDSLGFLLSAEFIKRLVPNSQVFLLIADQHAWLTNNMDKTSAQKIANIQEKTFRQIVSCLNLTDWHIFRAEELFPESPPQSYEGLEARDVSHFFHEHKVGIKIGWKSHSKNRIHKTDEAHFDQKLNLPMVSIFTKPGVTLNPAKQFESPYICTHESTRVLLTPNENVTGKLSLAPRNQKQAVQNQLKRITMLFERLIGPLPVKTPVEEKVKMILDKIFN